MGKKIKARVLLAYLEEQEAIQLQRAQAAMALPDYYRPDPRAGLQVVTAIKNSVVAELAGGYLTKKYPKRKL